MKILLNKVTTDADLKKDMPVCYQDINGAFTKLGVITDIVTDKDSIKNYLINTAMGAYMASELKLIAKPKLNTVKVLFADSKYNYITSVSTQTTEITAMQYFVGKHFNVGCYPVEDMQQCTGIEFTDNNLY